MRPLLALLLLTGCGPVITSDPGAAEIVTSDLKRFFEAFDEGTDAATLQRLYLDRGTPSLRAFVERRIGSAQNLSATVTRNQAYYASIRGNVLALGDADFASRVRAVFTAAKTLEPKAEFPPTALLIGRMNSGGTTSREGILIGLELFTASPDSPRDTFDDFERAAVRSASHLVVPLVAHEYGHVLQEQLVFPKATTLLEHSVMEGMAEFIGEKTSGKLVDEGMFEWAKAREAQLWTEFQAEMDGTDVSRWLYNKGMLADRPGDLGYFIGYRIAQAYALKVGSDTEAVQQMLRKKDLRVFMEESGYAGVAP